MLKKKFKQSYKKTRFFASMLPHVPLVDSSQLVVMRSILALKSHMTEYGTV